MVNVRETYIIYSWIAAGEKSAVLLSLEEDEVHHQVFLLLLAVERGCSDDDCSGEEMLHSYGRMSLKSTFQHHERSVTGARADSHSMHVSSSRWWSNLLVSNSAVSYRIQEGLHGTAVGVGVAAGVEARSGYHNDHVLDVDVRAAFARALGAASSIDDIDLECNQGVAD